MENYWFWKDSIHPRERTEPCVSKPHYKGSDNSNADLSHGEKDWSLWRHGWIF